jgi:hypothetical protein
LSFTTWCGEFESARCAMAVRCGAAAPDTECAKIIYPTPSVNQRLDCVPPWLREGVNFGRTTFNVTQAQACLDALRTSTACNLLVPFEPACLTVFTGTAQSGAMCATSQDCASGLYCDSTLARCPGTCAPTVTNRPPNPNACPPGTFYSAGAGDAGAVCVPPGNAGEACGAGKSFCVGTTFCAASLSRDAGSVCHPHRDAGAPCSTLAVPSECKVDSVCTPSGDAGSTCVLVSRRGEPCGNGRACQVGLACLGGTCQSLVSPGNTCVSDLDCTAFHRCGPAMTCVPLGGHDAGCTSSLGRQECAPGLFCNAALRCEPLRALNAPCTTGAECSIEQGLVCTRTDAGQLCAPSLCLP